MTVEPIRPDEPPELVIHSPLTGELVGTLPIASESETTASVARSRSAFAAWGGRSHRERRRALRSYVGVVLKNMDRVADVIRSETGKDRGEALAEVTAALTAMDFFTRRAGKLLAPARGRSWPFPTTKGWTEYHPRGVAAVITPWNYPFYLTMLSTFQALAAGCTVVAKPSEVTPHSGALVADLAREAGLDDDIVQVVHGRGSTGEALVRSDVDVIAFTGSTAVGKRIAVAAAQTLTPVILELGGKDALIVLEDAHVDRAARAAVSWGVFNSGQTCVGVERVYVVSDVYDEFLAAAGTAIERLNVATGDRGDIGPFISPSQVEIVERHVSDAIERGATIAHGGARHDTEHGTYYQPTLVVDVDHSMELMREETFGPVVPVMRVADEHEALALANDSRFGLHGSVWTKSRSRGARVASRMKTGTVAVNDHLINFFFPSITLAGTGDSGLGGHLGPDGLKSFCVAKSITSARTLPTTMLMGGWLPRRVGPRYWKLLAKALFGWRR
ncbi:MAG: aldehyde dehydrogenase family protein [Acidimicrobiia bacterium]